MSANIVADFLAHLAGQGIHPIDAMIADGKQHRSRLPGDKGKSKPFTYTIYPDHPVNARYNAYKLGISGEWWPKVDRVLSADEVARQRRDMEENRRRREAETARARAVAADKAKRIWEPAKPAPADHPYLVEKEVKPHDLRIASDGRLVVSVIDAAGKLHTLQFIDAAGSKLFLKDGAIEGNYSSITDGSGRRDTILICEGWATGATLHESTGLPVVVAFNAGNLLPVAKVIRDKYTAARLVICADNDCWKLDIGNVGVSKATAAAQAVDADLAVPDVTGIEDKPTDFNDVAVARGLGAVLAQLNAVLHPAHPGHQKAISAPSSEIVAPTYPAPIGSVEVARDAVARAVGYFFAGLHAWTVECIKAELDEAPAPLPPQVGVQVGVGIGKTAAARHEIVRMILIAKKRAADPLLSEVERAAWKRMSRGAVAVPTHKLSSELVEAFEREGVKAMAWKGRGADDNLNPGKGMCHDMAAVEAALAASATVETAACRVVVDGVEHLCPFYKACGYQRQKAEAAAADVVLVAHDSLFHGKPSAIGELGWLVVDESFWQSGLRGADGRPVAVTIDSLGASAYCRHHGGGWDMESSRALEAARGSLSAALRSHGNGPVALDALSAAGITADMCRTASSMEWSRKVGTALRPGMTAADRRKAVEAAAENRTIPALARVWDLLADAIEGTHDAAGVEVETVATDDGPLRRLRLRWHAEIRTGWCLPTLHTDATMKVDLVEHYLPRLTLTATCEAVMPNVTIRQVFDRPFSAKMLNPDAVTRDRDKATAQNNLARLHSYIVNRAREYRGRGRNGIDVLVIVQKAIEVRLVAMGLPAGVEIAHHGNVAGIDQWGGVALLVAVGRTSPAPGAVEALATAMTNRPAMPLPDTGAVPWYVKVNRGIRLTDGSVLKVEGDQHPDDVAEAVRWSIVEGGLIQSIGRGRGVNRSAGAPLQVDILTDVVLPLTVIEALTWDDVKPVASDVMMARGAALENSADMAAAFPDLFPSERAANTARQRTDTNAYREASIKANVSVLAAVAYRPAGAGKKLRSAWFDLTMIPNPAAWLTERLGPLASFEFITEPAASTPPVPAGQALSPTQLHKEPIAMTAAAPIMFTVPGLIPATVRAAPVEVAPVAEFRIGHRPVVELPKVAAIGIPGFGVSPDRDPGGVIDGCSDEVPPHRAPFDWGPADAWVEKHRRPPMPPTIPAVPDRATA